MHERSRFQNNSKEFSKMVGVCFDYIPKQQGMHFKEVKALASFGNKALRDKVNR